MNRIAIVTFTLANRLHLLVNCINSVKSQLGDLLITHYIWYKDDEVKVYLDEHVQKQDNIVLVKYSDPELKHTQQKMTVLRNMAIINIGEEYVGFLDDDNEYNSIHILSLLNAINEKGYSAAHSLRYLVYPDNTLYDGSFYPWHYDKKTTNDVYNWCIKNNILKLNSPIMFDRYVDEKNIFNVATIDMNEWLFKTSMIKAVKFNESFSEDEIKRLVGEDGKILESIIKNNIRYGTTNLPTVKYRLGGFSNYFSLEEDSGFCNHKKVSCETI